MTTAEYRRVLEGEISKLNKRIDFLILRNRPYILEAKRHHELVNRLRNLRNHFSIFGRLFSHALN